MVEMEGVAWLHGAAPEMESRGRGNGNRYRSRARQIGLNNVAQTHSTSRSHTHRRDATRMQAVAAAMILSCVMQTRSYK